ncbi:hypothetical protein RZQ49_32215, partial [Klebsiella michiganensis]|uniref:hypothetical protein n=1 Tax=Klebsiella michiganensis TaxID=1134687 RepID=UPI00292C0E5F
DPVQGDAGLYARDTGGCVNNRKGRGQPARLRKKSRAPAVQTNTGCATRRPYQSVAGFSLQYYLFVTVIFHPASCCLSLLVFILCAENNKNWSGRRP